MNTLIVITILTTFGFLFETPAQTDVTTPGDPIIGGQMIGGVFAPATQGAPAGNANMYPIDGLPAFVIDNGATSRYRNFGEVFTGFVVTPNFGHNIGGTFVSSFSLITAPDAPERDPLAFTLEGTQGDPLTGSYSLIFSGSTGLDVDPGRTAAKLTAFPVVGAFTSYRVIFPTVRNSTATDSMQIGEVQINGVLAFPEPSTFALLGISAIGILATRRR